MKAVFLGIHKLSDWFDSTCGVICVICLTAMVLITGAQIICRVFFDALVWSEEVARYLLIWSTFIGASCVYKRMGHINVTVIRDLFPQPVRVVMEVLVHLLCAAFFVLAVYKGYEYMGRTARQLSPALRLPMKYIYAAIPIGFGIMFLHVVDLLLLMIPGLNRLVNKEGTVK